VQILELLRGQADAGTTVLVVTHNQEISRAADRVVELSSGRIVHDGARAPDGRRSASCGGEPMGSPRWRLRLRWSWRDLRTRWPPVAAIALIIALGTGTFAGLGSTAMWRRQSNDASFALARMHDLRVTLPEGATVDEATLSTAIDQLPHADSVTARAERLVGSTQVDVVRPLTHGPHPRGGRGARAPARWPAAIRQSVGAPRGRRPRGQRRTAWRPSR
jgi:hypothetical protein